MKSAHLAASDSEATVTGRRAFCPRTAPGVKQPVNPHTRSRNTRTAGNGISSSCCCELPLSKETRDQQPPGQETRRNPKAASPPMRFGLRRVLFCRACFPVGSRESIFAHRTSPMADAIAIHGHDIIELVSKHPGGIRLGQLTEIVGERCGRNVTFHTCSAGRYGSRRLA